MTSESLLVEPAARAGTLAELQAEGRLLAKLGSLPVLVLWHEGRAYAIEDRCPHLGFPLRQGTVEHGMVTCHWHHARFDLASGCTLDPWADDALAFDVDVTDGEVWVRARRDPDPVGRLQERLREGLEGRLTLVLAKSALGLLDRPDADVRTIVRPALEFGVANRREGWGAGLTVLVAMANVVPHLGPADRPLAMVQALAFLARDTAGHAPRFGEPPLHTSELTAERLEAWYRRFVDTRSSDAAERVLATAARTLPSERVATLLAAAATDHLFLDEGHTLDFTNKACEALDLVGWDLAGSVLGSLVEQTCAADRAEESSEWRHPADLAALAGEGERLLLAALSSPRPPGGVGDDAVATLGWALIEDDPRSVVAALVDAARAGATHEELGRAVALAAALRIVRFHTRNDPGDWDSVHHGFTTANAVHALLQRSPTPELSRALVHGLLRVHLDRFLNVPAARLPAAGTGSLAALRACWDRQGQVEEAAAEVAGFLRAGGRRDELIAELGHALLQEDAGFHWFQLFEAGVRQARCWPEGSEPSQLILVAVARFLAAHTPTRRELSTVVRTAARLRRGEPVHEDEPEA
jgi:nitrite reductase/ring-hydroxylating ferredoxin subunit